MDTNTVLKAIRMHADAILSDQSNQTGDAVELAVLTLDFIHECTQGNLPRAFIPM